MRFRTAAPSSSALWGGLSRPRAGKTKPERFLQELRARPADAPTIVSEGWLLGALGEIDAAFELLARAEEECQALLYYTGLPGFDPLRADPRFGALQREAGSVDRMSRLNLAGSLAYQSSW